ncbi:UDP-N-acetylglucosamine 4,6-dehydratase (inverting) [Estrella lausannensis]|uniref:Polysaccharide biosynthesis protein n=1 Tax=Estrella lausannensis TaxID=483423 RepID=A0A0H5DPB5_9BACT|nr:UDP-N-acetylglucosamine 4,6-dehydratase (inverting) [Estrella lausannensis]CRX37793.1 Polysaccharide biosynthesis protein [Estrella lausannensis]
MDLHEFFKEKSILITGGTGSFGRKLATLLIRECDPRRVIIFSRDEWKQWEMKKERPEFGDPRMRYFIGDVRDTQRLNRAFQDVDYIVHAAALKQVPAAEYNPSEFVKTNVIGAMNVVEAAISAGVRKVIGLSTDKACNPVNLYGATKLCQDKLFVNGNSYVGKRGYPIFSVVRYGNVLGSRGSIIPLWRKILKSGGKAVPITDPRMTRFWITLEQSVRFVLESFLIAKGGEIFIPKIPSMKIIDLAEAVAPGVPHEFTGIREGEKLHELMICQEDARHSIELSDRYVILPETQSRDHEFIRRFLGGREGKPLPDGFAYTSDTNTMWIGGQELMTLIQPYLEEM